MALGYDRGRVGIRDARGEVVGSGTGFGGVRALLEVDGALVVLSRDGVRTRARLPDLAVERRVTAEGSWCGEVSGDDVWACVPGGMALLGPDLAAVRTVAVGFHETWGSARGPDGRLWVTGDGADGEPERSCGLAVFDPADPSTLTPILIDWHGTARDVTATPVGAVVGTWSGSVFETDDRAVFMLRTPTQPGRVQSVATAPDGWLEGAPVVVALGKDHGQIDLVYAARD